MGRVAYRGKQLMFVPADPLRRGCADAAFAPEAAAASHLVLLDHEALLRGEVEAAVARVPRGAGAHWYRGWMIPPDVYKQLDDVLRERETSLVVSPSDYARAHLLPGWYTTFARQTPATTWSHDTSVPALPASDGGYVIKDWVKSQKHAWDTACFAPCAAAAPSTAAEMVRLAGERLMGGVVVRAFERFVGREVRVFWLDFEPVLSIAHPDHPGSIETPALDEIAAAVRLLGCRFVTTDLAQRADGEWRVVEVGDGQVSDAGDPAAGRRIGELLEAR